MSMQDPIADFISAINNASRVFHSAVKMPHSRLKLAICAILQEQGYVRGFKVMDHGAKKELVIELKYSENKPTIVEFKRISKPSLRHYVKVSQLPVVYNGFGEAIISTSRGLMTAKQARSKNLGGEVICTIF